MAFIEISNIEKHYGTFKALTNVSLSVPKGSFITLLGPSGSGKTTLLKILAGFEGVSSGRVLLDGRDVTMLKPEKRNFGVVFQGYALFPHMSVYDNVAYPLKVRRKSSAEIREKVERILSLVQLDKFARRKPSELSGGQQQRVALARALVFEPDLLLLDEPMSALDKKLRIDLQEELRNIHQQLGTTFINVTHDQEEAMHMSDGIAVMNQGRIEQFGTAHELYRKPQSRFVADFIGKSNMISGQLETNRAGALFSSKSFKLSISCDQIEGKSDGKADLFIRPENILLTPGNVSQLQSDVVLAGEVVSATYSGDRALYLLKTADGRNIQAYGNARDGALQPGAPITLAFDGKDCILLT
ncbi:ABC transporter ATP-binding protein [Pseudochrobactrum sp. MP213Fo]|uniref:ABC transporter ATP-binding protein n=1 Tax=Pseudochrobactrum sp. MP213Fo TaxID=3022250 RepID=UPI003BA08557